jgi:hypothetical protein
MINSESVLDYHGKPLLHNEIYVNSPASTGIPFLLTKRLFSKRKARKKRDKSAFDFMRKTPHKVQMRGKLEKSPCHFEE